MKSERLRDRVIEGNNEKAQACQQDEENHRIA
jgi:hypothetical protein